jgi:hypothetical protein
MLLLLGANHSSYMLRPPTNFASLNASSGKPMLLNDVQLPSFVANGGVHEPKMSNDARITTALQGAKNSFAKQMDISLITPSGDPIDWIERVMQNPPTEPARRLASNDLLFTLDEGGVELYLTRFKALVQSGTLQIMGTAAFEDILQKERSLLPQIGNELNQALVQSLNISENAALVTMGLNANFDRIKSIDEYVRSRSGVMLCHNDVPAVSSMFSRSSVSNIPAFASPKFYQFLWPVLQNLKGQSVVLLDNILSKIAPSGLHELTNLFTSMNVDKVVIAQSKLITEGSSFFPHNMGPNDQGFSNAILLRAIPQIYTHKGNIPTKIIPSIVAGQAATTYRSLINEIVVRSFCKLLKEHAGLEDIGTSLALSSIVVDKKVGLEYIGKRFPPYLKSVLSGQSNYFRLDPWNITLVKDPRVPDGKIRLSQSEMFIKLSKGLDNKPETSVGNYQLIDLDDGYTPQTYLRQPAQSLTALFIDANAIQRSEENVLIENEDEFIYLSKIGAKYALDFAFDILGRQAHIQHIVEFFPEEAKLRERFGNFSK